MKPLPVRPQVNENDCLKKVLLLVDYSNVLYRSYFSSIKGWEERPWLPILRFIDSLRLCVQRSKVSGIRLEVIFAGESREKLERSKIDGSYKSQRIPVTHDIFRNFRKIMALVLQDMGTSVITRAGAEADDIIASIVGYVCRDAKPPFDNSFNKTYTTDVIVFSNDKDLYQLLRFDRCYIYQNPGVFYTRENFVEEYGFNPCEFDMYKAMVGDKSDNILGINGIGPVSATKHILDKTIPMDNPEFINSLNLIKLDYDLDVPDVGNVILLDDSLTYSNDHIFATYGHNTRAFEEISLALKMLEEIWI